MGDGLERGRSRNDDKDSSKKDLDRALSLSRVPEARVSEKRIERDFFTHEHYRITKLFLFFIHMYHA